MHDVAKLMEVRLHLVMGKQGGLIRGGLGEVGHHGCHRDLTGPILGETTGLGEEKDEVLREYKLQSLRI